MNEVKVSSDTINRLLSKTIEAANSYNLAAQTLGNSPAPRTGTSTDAVIAEWEKMRDDVYRVLAGSATNLVEVGRVVVDTAEAMGAQDSGNARELDKVAKVIEPGRPWQA